MILITFSFICIKDRPLIFLRSFSTAAILNGILLEILKPPKMQMTIQKLPVTKYLNTMCFQGLGFVAIARMRKTVKKSSALNFGSFVSRQRDIQKSYYTLIFFKM